MNDQWNSDEAKLLNNMGIKRIIIILLNIRIIIAKDHASKKQISKEGRVKNVKLINLQVYTFTVLSI